MNLGQNGVMQKINSPSLPSQSNATESVVRSRFGIGEWYGRSFTGMTPDDRLKAATFNPQGTTKLKKSQRDSLQTLRDKSLITTLAPRESESLKSLEMLRQQEMSENYLCPFKADSRGELSPCSKKGGVCSLRLYEIDEQGVVSPAVGDRGALRAVCPSRFHEKGTAFTWASEVILNATAPALVGEVGFLESSESVDGLEGEDVGRIDMVVVDHSKPAGYPLQWTALEIQAVYFSGAEMGKLFKQVSADVSSGGSGVVFPDDVRRPDYRSSGPKRLMPQLQIKVPTLRRWGKRMAIVVDRPFYFSMGLDRVETVAEVSNADIAWLVVDFVENASANVFTLKKSEVFFMTLEEAVKGLTGGTPVTLSQFEQRIVGKINS